MPDEPTYRRTHTRQPYVYVIGACDVPGAKQTVMDVHADLRDGAPDLPDALVAMGEAVWLSVAGGGGFDPGRKAPEGFAYRIVRLETPDYNRMVALANARGTEALRADGMRARGDLRVRYLRKARITPEDPDAWDISPWLAPDEQGVDFGAATLPADAFLPRHRPFDPRGYDGQHRLN